MDILVAGGGLCGTMAALALRQHQVNVTLLRGSALPHPMASATHLSYGGIPWWLGVGDGGVHLAGQGLARWQQLQERHGDVGLRPAKLLLHWSPSDDQAAVHGAEAALMALLPQGITPQPWGKRDLQAMGLTCAGAIQLPYGRIDSQRYRPAMAQVLQGQGVRCSPLGVIQVLVDHGRCTGVSLSDGTTLRCDGLVVATGAAMASLLPWQAASQWFPYSHASVLPLTQPHPYPHMILMPLVSARERLEHHGQAEVVVDPGLAPWAGGVMFGQTTSLQHQSRPHGAPGAPWLEPGQGKLAEAYLHRALAEFCPRLAVVAQAQQAIAHHCPVSYSPDGRPWVGPCPGLEGVWLFGGFRGAFALAPVLAPVLAQAITHNSKPAPALGVDPGRMVDPGQMGMAPSLGVDSLGVD